MANKKPNIPTETRVDLLVCLVVLPCLVAVFPVEEWIGWKASEDRKSVV